MKTHSILLIFLLSLVCSCKKSSNTNPFGNQKIATIDRAYNGAIQHYRIVYDASNNVDSMVITGGGTDTGSNGFFVFNYVGSSFTITDQNSNYVMVDANTNGQILKVLVTDTLSFLYNGSQLGEINEFSPIATYPYYTNTAYYYTWANGDVTAITSGSVSKAYTYNDGKNGQPGDAIRINQFLQYGQSYIKTNHLPSGLVNSATAGETYIYSFDSKGRISLLTDVSYDKTASSSVTVTFAYTYY